MSTCCCHAAMCIPCNPCYSTRTEDHYNLTLIVGCRDLADGECYAQLLVHLSNDSQSALAMENCRTAKRLAERTIEAAIDLGVEPLIRPSHILSANKRLNLAFVAQLVRCTV
jgi:hypothetical protein